MTRGCCTGCWGLGTCAPGSLICLSHCAEPPSTRMPLLCWTSAWTPQMLVCPQSPECRGVGTWQATHPIRSKRALTKAVGPPPGRGTSGHLQGPCPLSGLAEVTTWSPWVPLAALAGKSTGLGISRVALSKAEEEVCQTHPCCWGLLTTLVGPWFVQHRLSPHAHVALPLCASVPPVLLGQGPHCSGDLFRTTSSYLSTSAAPLFQAGHTSRHCWGRDLSTWLGAEDA